MSHVFFRKGVYFPDILLFFCFRFVKSVNEKETIFFSDNGNNEGSCFQTAATLAFGSFVHDVESVVS